MHARSLLDYLSDAERAERGEGHDARDWVLILERLQELELRLGDLRNASEQRETNVSTPSSDRHDLRDEISSILRRRGIAPQARRASPPPPLAPRDWVDPPPLAPVQAFHAPAERTDPNLLKFIEAVRLLGRAADRFMVEPEPQTPDHHYPHYPQAWSPERPTHATYQPQAARRHSDSQQHHSTESAPARVSDADLVRLWNEVEDLRRTLAQLSSRRDSY
jgi:hypothetical protein